MNNRKLCTLLIAAASLGALAGAAASRTQPEAGGAGGQPDFSKMSKDDLIKMMETMSAPVEQHKILEAFIGDFELKGTFSMGPGLEMSWESTGTGKKIIGGRFVEMNTVSKPGSKPVVETKAVFGYDSRPGHGKYTLWGIDSMGTYSVSAEGDYNAETKTLELLGTVNEGGRDVRFKQVFNIADPASHTAQVLFEMEPGKWATVVDMKVTRKK